MSDTNIPFDRKPCQKHAILTDDELSRLWKAAISDDDTLADKVMHDLRDSHASLRDGVFLF